MIMYQLFILISFLQLKCAQNNEMGDSLNVQWLQTSPGLSNEECDEKIYIDCNRGAAMNLSADRLEIVRQYLNNTFTTVPVIKPDKPLCPSLRVRVGWKCLSDVQRDRIIAVWQQMYDDGTMAYFSDLFDKNWPAWTKTFEFFPALRRLLVEFEMAMIVIDPRVTLPYWDWWIYGVHPERSSVWSFLGTAGNYSNGYCVLDGNFTGYLPCLKRQWTCRKTIYPWVTAEILTSILQSSSSYALLFSNIVSVNYQHHANIAGYEGQYSQRNSPYDPIFWMSYAALIDILFLKWQLGDENNLVPLSYNALGYKFNQTNGYIEPTNIAKDTLTGFADPKPTVRDQFMVGFGDLCYITDQIVPIIVQINNNMTDNSSSVTQRRLLEKPWLIAKHYPKFYEGQLGELYHLFEEFGQCNNPPISPYGQQGPCLGLPKPTFLQETETGRGLLDAFAYDGGVDMRGLIELFQQKQYELWKDLNGANYCSPLVTP